MDQDVDVNTAIESAILMLNSQIKKATNRFITHFGEALPIVRGNYHQIEQVIMNLITNACQALTEPNQAVNVTTRYESESDCITISVKDEGVGIPEEDLLRITDPFFTTKRDSGGTGLGLAVSYRIAENHDGSLTFKSKSGIGTTAYLRLPAGGERQ